MFALGACHIAAAGSIARSTAPLDPLRAEYVRGQVSTAGDTPPGAVIERIDLPKVTWPWFRESPHLPDPGTVAKARDQGRSASRRIRTG